jgi:hypothetical protein
LIVSENSDSVTFSDPGFAEGFRVEIINGAASFVSNFTPALAKKINGIQWKLYDNARLCEAGQCGTRAPTFEAVNGKISIDFVLGDSKPDSKIIDQILSTFKFTPSPVSGYVCPTNSYVDCTSGPNSGVKYECTPQALNWFKANCPNFKGIAQSEMK